MRFLLVSALVIAGLAGFGAPSNAQSTLRDNPQPAELPPASFTGRQYVDSRGCVYIRAGSGWVPRVRRDRSHICGANPSQLGQVVQTVRSTPTTVAPQVQRIVPQPSQRVATAPTTVPHISRQISAPRSLTHGIREEPGYKTAWTDGRLNPSRGLGAVSAPSHYPTSVQYVTPTHRHTTGSAGNYVEPYSPQQTALGGHRYVQVGTFGVSSNATNLVSRLQSRGLPAQVQPAGRFIVVLVGPFGSSQAAQSALSTVRSAGFSDAFLQR